MLTSNPGGCPYPCFKDAQKEVGWDSITRKRVRGLDHYCKVRLFVSVKMEITCLENHTGMCPSSF